MAKQSAGAVLQACRKRTRKPCGYCQKQKMLMSHQIYCSRDCKDKAAYERRKAQNTANTRITKKKAQAKKG